MSTTKTNTSTSSGTQSGQFSQQNQFERLPGASSPDIDALRSAKYEVDPNIAYRGASSRARLNKLYNNPAGGFVTPQMRDRLIAQGGREIDQDSAMASRAGQFDVNNLNMQKGQFLAGLTAPPLVNTGASGTSSGTTSGTSTDKFKTPFSAKIMPALQTGAQVAAAVA